MKKLLLLILFTSLSPLLWAAERILNFDVTLSLHPEAVAVVTEEITVNVEHKEIRKGIIRVLPQSRSQKIDIRSLSMDGREHPFFIENVGSNIEVNFGDDRFLPLGEHTYTLVYTMQNAAGLFPWYDEVYWNVTGNDWIFPIDRASFNLILPSGASVIEKDISFYTGRFGQKSKDAVQTGPLSFETTKTLVPGEGFTVAVPFKKGTIKLSPEEELKYMLKRYLPLVLFAVLAIYCLITWLIFGKDPWFDGRVLYAPPTGVSPALIRFIKTRKFDITSFASILISLSLKNKIQMKNITIAFFKTMEVSRIDKNTDGLPEEEKFVLEMLFNGAGSSTAGTIDMINMLSEKINNPNIITPIDMTNTDKIFIAKSYQPHMDFIFKSAKKLVEDSGKSLVSKNTILTILPIILITSMLFLFDLELIVPNLILLIILLKPQGIFALIFVAVFLYAAGLFSNQQEIIFFASIALFHIYKHTINNSSKEGKQLYLDTLGFERYIKSAEKGRVMLSNPEDDAKIFADYLPYAYALGLSSKWMKAFKNTLSADVMNREMDKFGGEKVFTSSVLASSLSSSTVRRSSGRSSGSGGRGSSGGGSGGGGGRGR